MEVTLWKKCESREASSGKSGSPCSTMTLALAMSDHCTGIPVSGSRVPQRPGPMSRYLSPSRAICELWRLISSAISSVRNRSNLSGSTYTTSRMYCNFPFPIPLSAFSNTWVGSMDRSSMSMLYSFLISGLICKR